MTTRITGSFPFTAPPEVVFDVLTDPDRTYRWLPEGTTTPQIDEYAVSKDPSRLRVRWARPDGTGLTATAQLHDAPAGGSILDAELVLPETWTDEQRADELLADSMNRLQRDVSDNFNAG
ncbi:hypothetical protein COUCH_32135 [Couchioplanes caeruleus]|uniref:SRPBCC family protein n=1 Tax=Couchioplanes caeruleus TaxID=56438 RepID=UPI0020C04F1C|nr:hypothetical protein [Couchioplanes caeruleus]UQU63606.1 hypothetical protein COUCH_32135 [Couchioplanes caeruleus]